MGWNSWNKFGCNVDEKMIRDMADAMVTSGMKDAGYNYIVIDDCWQVSRDAQGNIVPDPNHFPSGMKALADYVHSKGLKFGLYSDAGTKTCAGRPGSSGYEYQDARQYAAWGVDYLKYDWCRGNADHGEQVRLFTAMRNALHATGRHIFYSINPNSSDDHRAGITYDWSPIADMARTTADLVPVWRSTLPPVNSADSFLTGTSLGVPDEFAASVKVATSRTIISSSNTSRTPMSWIGACAGTARPPTAWKSYGLRSTTRPSTSYRPSLRR